MPGRAASRSRASAGLAALGGALLATGATGGRAAAQERRPAAPADTGAAAGVATRAELDSLRARVARAEAAVELLRRQLATEAESAVRTRSRTSLDLTARALVNAYWTSRPANDFGVPAFALPPAAPGDEASAVGVMVRQTRVGAALTVRDVLGGTFEGDVDLDLFGGARDASGNRPLFAEPRLRTLRAAVHWPRWSVMAGAETPLVSDLDPRSAAAVGIPLFATAGNLWNWLPQVRASRTLGGRTVRWAAQGAVLMPFANAGYGAGLTTPPVQEPGAGPPLGDGAERSGRPYVQARLRARWGAEDPDAGPGAEARDFDPGDGPSEVGVGVHRGWVRVAGAGILASRALAADARVAFGGRFELRGEAYAGRLVAGLGGGAVGQNFGRPAAGAAGLAALGAPLRDVAGWAQLNAQLGPALLAGGACGADRVRDADQPVRRGNLACAAHVRWRPAQPLLVGFEYRRLSTRYAGGGRYGADHLNLALGFDL